MSAARRRGADSGASSSGSSGSSWAKARYAWVIRVRTLNASGSEGAQSARMNGANSKQNAS